MVLYKKIKKNEIANHPLLNRNESINIFYFVKFYNKYYYVIDPQILLECGCKMFNLEIFIKDVEGYRKYIISFQKVNLEIGSWEFMTKQKKSHSKTTFET